MSLTAITIEGTLASTYARNVKVLGYGKGAKRGRNLVVPFRDGEWTQNPKWFTGSNLVLEVMLKTTPSPEENLSDLVAAFHTTQTTSTITATHPFAGAIRCEVEMLRPPVQSQSNPNIYRFPLRNPDGMWEDASASSNAGNPPAAVTLTGDLPVDDFTLTYAGAGFLEHTASDGTVSRITLESGVPASTIVDLGNRTVTQGGSDYDALVTITQPWWMRFEPGATQSFTSDVSVTVSWRNHWAV